MTVGELAAKVGVSVRTLQYYHKEGILLPSAQSEGGRRLYSNKDLVMLQQILSLKHLGFSLDEIREQIISLESPEQVSAVLDNQKAKIKAQMENLKGVLIAIDALQKEIRHSNSVDFSEYANIISTIHSKWENFWMIGAVDEELAGHALQRYDEETGKAFGQRLQKLIELFATLQQKHLLPESTEAQTAAKEWWDMVVDFTNGDFTLLSHVYNVYLQRNRFDDEWQEKWEDAESLMQQALSIYLETNNIHVEFPIPTSTQKREEN